MRSPFLRCAAAALTAAALAGCAQQRPGYVGPAPSITSPWKIVQTVGPADGESMMADISATGPRDAWAIAQVCGSSCGSRSATLAVEHWDGSSWRQLPAMPRRVLHADNAFVGASSDTDAWVFAEFDRGADALHWDGRRWKLFKAPGCGRVFPAVFGPDDAWAFSDGSRACGAHFNGRRWRKVVMPGIPGAVSAVSRNDIWAEGVIPPGRGGSDGRDVGSRGNVAMHWNGRSWAAIAFPDLHLRSSQRLVGGNIAAAGPRSVWVEYGIQTKDSNALTELLLHWDGASWHRIPVPLAPFGVWSMARDGRGGLWLTADGDGPAGLTWFFYHVSRGQVTLVPAPAKRGSAQLYGAGQLAWVPGTTSLWAIETLSSGPHESQGAILSYRS
jgi:hypothetical protein